MANKKYYWLKLKKDFFKDKRMKKLRKIAGGEIYTLIYLKLQLLSLENEGVLVFENIEDSFYEELALEIDEEKIHVEATLFLLEKWELIEKIETDKILLVQTVESIGTESSSASRVRKLRSRSKALQCNATVTKCNEHIEIEKEIEKETTTIKKIENKNSSSSLINLFKKHNYEISDANIKIIEKLNLEESEIEEHLKYTIFKNKGVGFLIKSIRENWDISIEKIDIKKISSKEKIEYMLDNTEKEEIDCLKLRISKELKFGINERATLEALGNILCGRFDKMRGIYNDKK